MWRFGMCLCLVWGLGAGSSLAQTFPVGFVDTPVLSNLSEPATLVFAPDGRLFVGERITGRLLVAERSGDSWSIVSEFHTFDIPKNPDGSPARHRSSGLRDIAFDPDFTNNRRLYAFFMQDNPRHNRVVRLEASAADPNVSDPASETVLIDLPFNDTGSSGSHNGGAVEFGDDGFLYITTGDGWSGGDDVQSLTTFTGKVLRIGTDGSIPNDNPFYDQTNGAYRAIYALGLRNPFSMALDPESGDLFVNDAVGAAKANIYRLEAGANYGHQGGSNVTPPWANASAAGELVTGGAWYPATGSFPAVYHGSYFVALWGSNGSNTDGAIGRILGLDNPVAEPFATQVHDGSRKPILTRVDPLTGDLFYALTTYETELGSVHRIRWTGEASAAVPSFDPVPGTYETPVSVTMASATPDAVVRYTTDGSDPTDTSATFETPVSVTESTVFRARAYAPGLLSSGVVEAEYVIGSGANLPPVAIAGADQRVQVGTLVTLNGAASYDPDGNDEELIEQWVQVSGPAVAFTGDDFVSFFTPAEPGEYRFELQVSDGLAQSTADTTVTAEACLIDVLDDLAGRWAFDEGSGEFVLDSAGGRVGQLEGPTWLSEGALPTGSALAFDGVDDLADLGSFDLGGDALTIASWFRADDFEQMDGRMISKADGVQPDDHLWMLSTIASGGDHFMRGRLRSGGSTTTLIADSGALDTDRWYHAALVYDGAMLMLFLDGVEVGSTPMSGAIDTDPLLPVALGNQPQGGRPFDGAMDDLRLYGRALSPAELELLAGGTPRSCTVIFSNGFEAQAE